MSEVGHVGAGLIADANDIQGNQHGVHEDGENRMEDMSDEHDALDQEQEEREDGDDDVELGGAAQGGCQRTISLSFAIPEMLTKERLTMPPMAMGSEWADNWHSHR